MSLFKRYKTIKEMIPGFLKEKEVAVQRKSFLPYINASKVLTAWLEDHGKADVPMKRITSQNMADFFLYLGKEKNLDKPSCEHFLLNIRQLFRYALKRGEIDNLPFDLIIMPKKKPDQGADIIPQDTLKPLLLEIKEKDPQLYLACMIQYYCFIRPGKELRLLKVGDIDFEYGTITVRQELAKNKKRQIVTMPQHLINICKDYGIDQADSSLYVFGKKKIAESKPISVNMLRWRFNKFRRQFNLSNRIKFYSFKHTGASNLHMSGISMRELMDQLRHSKLEATSHYLKQHCGIVNERIRYNFPSPI
jgi:integrase